MTYVTKLEEGNGKMTVKDALNKVIDAWEALPGGRNYSPSEIAEWLRKDMSPAINAARQTLGRPKPR